jgi:predicted Rossmann fold flavoprotein
MEQRESLADVVIVGAGAAGLFCAAHLGQAGLKVIVVDNGKKPGRKILMSGGGRCNFTNLYTDAGAYLSQNPHFCKSALARYSQWDFIELVSKYAIPYHEKALGQLFCDNSAEDIVDMLLSECEKGHVTLQMRCQIEAVTANSPSGFCVASPQGNIYAKAVVIASGGLSMPGLGATPFGYHVARQFAINVIETRAGLVPFTLHKPLLEVLNTLSGVALPVTITLANQTSFRESLLFTHRGLSGPAILQISNYWQPGEYVDIDLLPDGDAAEFLAQQRQSHPNQTLKNVLSKRLPKRLVDVFQQLGAIDEVTMKQLNEAQIARVAEVIHCWRIQPNGTEGYRTAEVTLGGVDTRELSSKTMESNSVAGLFFIGEVIDVTGWLGGYNFQWAWSSARACSAALIEKLADGG